MPSRKRTAPGPSRDGSFPIVCIGASAGGLDAFSKLLESLPASTGMGFVIIQHLDPSHPSALPPILAKRSPIPVVEARERMKVQRDHAYVIPPDASMIISGGALRLAARAPGKRFMPIDHFMRSLAAEVQSRAIGVILSGTGSDGTLGLEAIKAEGGLTFAQEEKSAQYQGMPESAVASGCVDFVLPPAGIARELAKFGRHPILPGSTDGDPDDFCVAGDASQFARIFDLLLKGTGLDFTSYKRTTIRRRIARRMTLHKFTAVEDYIGLLRKSKIEVEALTRDLLIKVTTFFRDSDAFDALRKRILPTLIKHKKPNDSFRVWVPGCSTGEEVYSIGMCLIEAVAETAPGLQCQIFATDISEEAIDKARSGFYSDAVRQDVSAARLRRFFIKTAEGYRIAKMVRDLCIFARQDLTKDPPFSKLDLISCRNVLIYMGSDLQRRIIPIFHYALNPGGHLMLGSAESTGSFSHLFRLTDKKGKIYTKRPLAGDARMEFPAPPPVARRTAEKKPPKAEIPASETDLFKEADRITLTRYSPAGVLLNDELEVLQFRGHTGPYLEHAPGKPSVSILKLVREGMVFELRAAADKALKTGGAVRTPALELRQNGTITEVTIDVVPIRSALSEKPFLLVLFTGASPGKRRDAKGQPQISQRTETKLVQQLRRELNAVREELQSVIEEQESAQEEFKSANEEILSSNEELQSTNEELETAKEELQSANEELTTLNEELLTRNSELGQLNSDITNLLASINIPIVMLSQDLRIRRFTPVAGALLNLIPGDVGRPITDINPNIDLPKIGELVTEVIDTMSVKELEVRAKDGRWYVLRIRPYRTIDNKIEGATITILDIDILKKSQQTQAIVDMMREPVLVLDGKLRVMSTNQAFTRYFKTAEEDTIGKQIYELGSGQWNVPALRTLLEEVLPKRSTVEDFKVAHDFPKLGRRSILVSARLKRSDIDGEDFIVVTFGETSQDPGGGAAPRKIRRGPEPRRSEAGAEDLGHGLSKHPASREPGGGQPGDRAHDERRGERDPRQREDHRDLHQQRRLDDEEPGEQEAHPAT
jgi:two-component system CheB/CheR fusion protein